MTVRTIKKQDYEKNHISPSGLTFFKDEKELCEIVSMHCIENIKENILILEKLSKLDLKDAEILEISSKKSTLYAEKTKAQQCV